MSIQETSIYRGGMVDASRLAGARRMFYICAITVTLMACLGLTGWIFDVGAFKSIAPGLATMKANTAIGLLLIGSSLLLLGRRPVLPVTLRLGRATAWAATAVTGATLTQYLFDLNFGLDELAFRDSSIARALHPGRMAPLTAVSLTLLGCAILLLDRPQVQARRVAHALAISAGIIGLVAMVGYLYHAVSLYRTASTTSMALHTSIAIIIAALAILCSRPRIGVMKIVLSPGPGGTIARRLLPIGLAVPIILGWLRLWGQRAGYYGTEVGLGLMIITMIAIVVAMILSTAHVIDRSDHDRLVAEQFFRAQRLESLGTLAGGVAHDLNNLLLPVLMSATLLKRMDPDERTQKVIDGIERSIIRGKDLVKRVLLFAAGSEGERTAVDIGGVVADVETAAMGTFPRNIKFSTTIPATLASVIGDRSQLTQVLLNLAVNARDAMPGGGQITISATTKEIDEQYAVMRGGAGGGPYIVIEVADDGRGIPEDVIGQIFDPFFTTKEATMGTGLGLSMAQGVLRSHGGFIDVSSEIGRGSTFRVHLPAHTGNDTGLKDNGPEHAPRGSGEVILVVDDETAILDITRQTLEAFGYSVLTAEDGAQAVAEYARDPARVAAVLTDMMMPVMDGAALIKAVRLINPSIPIIAASGRASAIQIAQAKEAGGISFLSKPYSADLMLRTLSNALENASAPHEGRTHA